MIMVFFECERSKLIGQARTIEMGLSMMRIDCRMFETKTPAPDGYEMGVYEGWQPKKQHRKTLKLRFIIKGINVQNKPQFIGMRTSKNGVLPILIILLKYYRGSGDHCKSIKKAPNLSIRGLKTFRNHC